MKKVLSNASAGPKYSLAFTLIGWLIGLTSYIGFDTTAPWLLILIVSCGLAFVAYLILAKYCDSPSQFAKCVFKQHTVISLISIAMSFVMGWIFNSRLGLYMICLSFGIAFAGYIEPALHIVICKAINLFK